MPKGRLYEPRGLTTLERRDKARAAGKCRRNSRNRYCRLTRCIRKLEGLQRKGKLKAKSPVAVCRASVYGK